jgi:hypothetical protein
VIWASAVFAGWKSIRKLAEHGHTAHVGAGIADAVLGIVGNQVVARDKLVVGRRINSATLIADARHSWLDALSSAGALAGLIAVALGQALRRPGGRAGGDRVHLPRRLGGHRRGGAPPGRWRRSVCHHHRRGRR